MSLSCCGQYVLEYASGEATVYDVVLGTAVQRWPVEPYKHAVWEPVGPLATSKVALVGPTLVTVLVFDPDWAQPGASHRVGEPLVSPLVLSPDQDVIGVHWVPAETSPSLAASPTGAYTGAVQLVVMARLQWFLYLVCCELPLLVVPKPLSFQIRRVGGWLVVCSDSPGAVAYVFANHGFASVSANTFPVALPCFRPGSVSWSPDGRYLAVFNGDHAIGLARLELYSGLGDQYALVVDADALGSVGSWHRAGYVWASMSGSGVEVKLYAAHRRRMGLAMALSLALVDRVWEKHASGGYRVWRDQELLSDWVVGLTVVAEYVVVALLEDVAIFTVDNGQLAVVAVLHTGERLRKAFGGVDDNLYLLGTNEVVVFAMGTFFTAYASPQRLLDAATTPAGTLVVLTAPDAWQIVEPTKKHMPTLGNDTEITDTFAHRRGRVTAV